LNCFYFYYKLNLGGIMMKKNLIFGLLVAVLSILMIVACGGTPTPAPAPAPAPAAPPPPPPPPAEGIILDGATNYTVVRGDTLSDIAARKYGGSNMFFFPLIRLANSGVISDPDVIEIDTNLVIPDLQRNLDSVGANVLMRAETLRIAAQYDIQDKPIAATKLKDLATRLSR
jgi:hypothetical protein